jgi:hypothetical protein
MKKKITKDQAIQLLDMAKAVVVDEEGVCGVCFHNTYEEAADVGDMWLEARFEDSDGREFEFEVTEAEGITWDGTTLTVVHEDEELTFLPLVSARMIPDFVKRSNELLAPRE